MVEPLDSYNQLIKALFTKNRDLSNVVITESILPLKYALQNENDEANWLLESVDMDRFSEMEQAFLLEARLIPAFKGPINHDQLALAEKIVGLYPKAYFANSILGMDAFHRGERSEASERYNISRYMLDDDEEGLTKVVIDRIFKKHQDDVLFLIPSLKSRVNRLFAWLGLISFSSSLRMYAVFGATAVIAWFFPSSKYIFLPLMGFFLLGLIYGKARSKVLLFEISYRYLLFLGIFWLGPFYVNFGR